MKYKIELKKINFSPINSITKSVIIIFVLLLSSCVSVPKQAPVLSEELGNKVRLIQNSHIRLLESYFDEKRKDIDDFVMKTWAPLFAKELFNLEDIKKAWQRVIDSNNDNDKLKFLTIVGPAIQLKINKKRLELINPLDALEKDLKSKINNEYNIAFSINNTITSFLYSAAKVDENRDRYLNKLGITDEKIDAAIEDTSVAVNTLLGLGDKALRNEATIKEYLIKIKEIKDKLKNK